MKVNILKVEKVVPKTVELKTEFRKKNGKKSSRST